MRIEVYEEEGDMGSALEIANALIKYYVKGDFRECEAAENMLAETIEHIQVYLKHNK